MKKNTYKVYNKLGGSNNKITQQAQTYINSLPQNEQGNPIMQGYQYHDVNQNRHYIIPKECFQSQHSNPDSYSFYIEEGKLYVSPQNNHYITPSTQDKSKNIILSNIKKNIVYSTQNNMMSNTNESTEPNSPFETPKVKRQTTTNKKDNNSTPIFTRDRTLDNLTNNNQTPHDDPKIEQSFQPITKTYNNKAINTKNFDNNEKDYDDDYRDKYVKLLADINNQKPLSSPDKIYHHPNINVEYDNCHNHHNRSDSNNNISKPQQYHQSINTETENNQNYKKQPIYNKDHVFLSHKNKTSLSDNHLADNHNNQKKSSLNITPANISIKKNNHSKDHSITNNHTSYLPMILIGIVTTSIFLTSIGIAISNVLLIGSSIITGMLSGVSLLILDTNKQQEALHNYQTSQTNVSKISTQTPDIQKWTEKHQTQNPPNNNYVELV